MFCHITIYSSSNLSTIIILWICKFWLMGKGEKCRASANKDINTHINIKGIKCNKCEREFSHCQITRTCRAVCLCNVFHYNYRDFSNKSRAHQSLSLNLFLITRTFNHVAAAPLPSSPFLFENILFTLFASDQCQIISFVFKGFSIPMTALNDAALSFIFIKLQIFINAYLFKT